MRFLCVSHAFLLTTRFMRFLRFLCVSYAFLVRFLCVSCAKELEFCSSYRAARRIFHRIDPGWSNETIDSESSIDSIIIVVLDSLELFPTWQVFVGAGAVIGPGSIGAKCARAKVMDSLLYALPFHAELPECYSYHCFLRMSKSGIWEPKSGSQRNVSSTQLGILMLSCRSPARLTSYFVVHISLDVVLSEPGSIDNLYNKT